MKKKIALLTLAASLVFAGTGVAVHAYLTDGRSTPNSVRIAGNDVHIEEQFDPPADPSPGDTIVKKPCVVNDSEVPVYVRMRPVFTSSEGEGQCEPLEIREGWKAGEDGWYYYENAVAPGEKTGYLFEKVVLKKDLEKEALESFDILVYAESVQKFGFASPQEAFAALQEG